MNRVGAIILAAGASTRLGQPKQLIVLSGETLLQRAIRMAAAICNPVLVVAGANLELIHEGCDLTKARIVVNAGWAEGMSSSIRSGVEALGQTSVEAVGGVSGVIVMTCDMPAVTSDHLRRLVEGGLRSASFYGGRLGVPAFFPASSFSDLLNLRGEGGAQLLLREARTVELAGGEIDVDTKADLGRLKAFEVSGEETEAVMEE